MKKVEKKNPINLTSHQFSGSGIFNQIDDVGCVLAKVSIWPNKSGFQDRMSRLIGDSQVLVP